MHPTPSRLLAAHLRSTNARPKVIPLPVRKRQSWRERARDWWGRKPRAAAFLALWVLTIVLFLGASLYAVAMGAADWFDRVMP